MSVIKTIQDKILGTSLQRKTKILFINTTIGLFLLTGAAIGSLIGLKHDYDSTFLNQEQKLKQLVVIQNIYSSILAEFLKKNSISQKISHLRKAWQDFVAIQEDNNYGTRFKDFYADLFLDYQSQIKELSQSEKEIAQIINNYFSTNETYNFSQFQNTAFSLNQLLHKAIQLRIKILNLKKNASDSLFTASIVLITSLLVMIVLATLFFSKIIISSIEDLYNSLENIIFQKTKKLREFNDDLQQIIQKKIKESRQKDQIMYQQARLASIGEMIQNIAHQWRQPLNSLTLIIQSFKIKFEDGNLSQNFVESQTQNALRIAKNMSDTIENFRNFFQPNSTKKSFNIAKSIQDSINIIKATLLKNGIDIFVLVPEEISLLGYENAFTQVVLNLINNAQDAILMENVRNGIIEISFDFDDEEVSLVFLDNAGGIKTQEIEKIFEPYFTTKHQSLGTGVGLYMVKQIVEKQLDGRIVAQNQEWESKITHQGYYGASFKITLPRSSLLQRKQNALQEN